MSLLASIFGKVSDAASGGGDGCEEKAVKSTAAASAVSLSLFDTLPSMDVSIKQRQEQLELRKLQQQELKKKARDVPPTNTSSSKKKRKREKTNNEDNAPENAVTKQSEGGGEEGTAEDTVKEQTANEDEDDNDKQNDNDGGDEEEESRRTIFVGNLPLTFTRKALQKLFAPCGKIASTRLRSVAIAPEHGVKLPPERAGNQALVHKVCVNTGKTLGTAGKAAAKSACIHGYVVFESIESVDAALKFNNTTIPDDDEVISSCRRIRVDCANPTYDATRSIFVGNLPYHANEDSLQQHFFRGCDLPNIADIEAVRIVRDTGANATKCKGFGYILFKDKSMVSTALRHMNGTLYLKRPLRVQVCGRRFKGSNKGNSDVGGGNSVGGSNSGRTVAKSSSVVGEKKKRWDDEDRPRKMARGGGGRDGGEQDNEGNNKKKDNNDLGNVGALRRLLGKQAAASQHLGSQHHSDNKKHHRARGVKKTGGKPNKSTKGAAAAAGSKRAAVEAKVEKRVKKIQKRLSKGMGKTRIK